MSALTPAIPALEPLWLRVPRLAVAILLALALTVIVTVVVLGFLPAVRAAFVTLIIGGSELPNVTISLTILFVVFLPLSLLVAAARKRVLTWTALATGWVVVLPVLFWLAWDEPAIRQSVSIEEFSPVFPGAEQSNAVLMQYSTKTPSEAAKAFAAMKLVIPSFGTGPQDAAKWVGFVTKNRVGLETDWGNLAPQRRWLDQLAAFDRIGDLTPADLGANIINFQVWRTLGLHACGIATLQALDGHGDDAMATLVPLLEVSRKLQLSSRTLRRSQIAEVVEHMALQTAGIVLDHAAISWTTRNRLSATLANENVPVLACHMIMVDFVQFAPAYSSMKLGDFLVLNKSSLSILRTPLNFISGLFINPNATMNLYGDHVRELAVLAETREFGKIAARDRGFLENLLNKPGMKNLGGRLMLTTWVPVYKWVIELHWKIADLRDRLRSRLSSL